MIAFKTVRFNTMSNIQVKKEFISDDENQFEALQSKVNTMRLELEKAKALEAKKELLRVELKEIRAGLKQYKQSNEKRKGDFSSELGCSAHKKQKVNDDVIIIDDDDEDSVSFSIYDNMNISADTGVGIGVDMNVESVSTRQSVHNKSTVNFDLDTVINDIDNAQAADTIKESSASRLKVIAKLLHNLQLQNLVSFVIKAKDATDATDSTKTCWEKSYPNSILGWAEMHVNDPVELKKIISDMIQQSQNQNGIWKTQRSMGKNLTGPVYRLFTKIGVTPKRNSRGPKESDTGKTENFYHYVWIFIDNKSFHKS